MSTFDYPDEFPTRFLVLDTETTGFGPNAKIVELGAIYVDFEAEEEWDQCAFFTTLVNSTDEMPPEAFAVHGITVDMLKVAPLPGEVAIRFEEWVDEHDAASLPVFAHHVAFDRDMMAQNGYLKALKSESNQVRFCDSVLLAKAAWGLPDNSLETLARTMGIEHDYGHRALGDCVTVLFLMFLAYEQLNKKAPVRPSKFKQNFEKVVALLESELEKTPPNLMTLQGVPMEEQDFFHYVLGPDSPVGTLVRRFRDSVYVNENDKHESLLSLRVKKNINSLTKSDSELLAAAHSQSVHCTKIDLIRLWDSVKNDGALTRLINTKSEDVAHELDICIAAVQGDRRITLMIAEALYVFYPETYPYVFERDSSSLGKWMRLVDATYPLDGISRSNWNGGYYAAYAIACNWLLDYLNRFNAGLDTFRQLESFLDACLSGGSPVWRTTLDELARYFRLSDEYKRFEMERSHGSDALDFATRREHGSLQLMLTGAGRFLGYHAQTEYAVPSESGDTKSIIDAVWQRVDVFGRNTEAVFFEVQVGGSVKNAMSNLFDALRFHGSGGRAVFVGSQRDISKAKTIAEGQSESKMVSYWDYNEFRLASTYLFTAMEKFSIMGFFSEDISFKADEAPYIGQNDRSTKLIDEVDIANARANAHSKRRSGRPVFIKGTKPICQFCGGPMHGDGRKGDGYIFKCKVCKKKKVYDCVEK